MFCSKISIENIKIVEITGYALLLILVRNTIRLICRCPMNYLDL